MGTQGKNENILYVQRQRTRSIYTAFTLILCITCWLSGSFTLIFVVRQITHLQIQNAKTPLYISKANPTSNATYKTKVTTPPAVIDPIVTSTPISAPSPAPISHFPVYLDQQIALLQANHRFLSGGNPNIPEVALTFDDGPNPIYTSQILGILRHYKIHASFFVIGRNAQLNPSLVKREYNNGNIVGNHTWAHPYLPSLYTESIQWQLITTSNLIKHILGQYPIYFRPPYGGFNSSVLTVANSLGDTTVLWNVDPRDWSMPGVDTIVSRVLQQTRNGSIILLHDGGGDRSETVAALPVIIDTLLQSGFHFVTLPKLINDTHNNGPITPQKTDQSPPQRHPRIPLRVN